MDTIKVTLVSPIQRLCLPGNKQSAEYVQAPDRLTDEFTRCHRAHCNRSYLARGDIGRDYRFCGPPLPDDA
ncbi:hypothetical protein GTC050_01160 [Burkholderia pseudomallei]|nr:hypothetical protein GTC050_01160 [Burkholderia pseudomallei]